MSEKIVLTQEQAEAIKEIKDADYAINILALKKRPDHPLATLEISEVAKLLYGLVDYEVQEVQPEFKEGDMVVTNWENATDLYILHAPYPEINDLKAGKGWRLIGHNYGIQEKNIRHATPEEIFWLHELGRKKVPDFHEGDIYVDNTGKPTKLYSTRGFHDSRITIEDAVFNYNLGIIQGIYPAESFKPFRKDEAK